ncbi:MAG TPA: TlpA disulfide reductase family protein [Candidatus Limnocylindria bacterium]|nr:TlpA disulfide reductase family protein [Candidatus Limnocylindria bacterium]
MTTKAERTRGAPKRRRTAVETRSRTPLLVAGGVLALAVVAAVIALVVATQAPKVAQPAANVTISGEALPPMTPDGEDPAIGMRIPTLSGTGIDGQPMTISPDEGPMVIVVLAHWCPHCQAELPRLVDWLEEHGAPDGVRVVGLTTGIDATRPNYPPSTWLEREGWTEPTLVDDAGSRALQALGVSSFPGFVAVDEDGRVVERRTGEIGGEAFGALLESVAP